MSTCGGGGIRCENSDNCTFTNNLIENNTALYKGAGVISINCNNLSLTNTTIANNQCTESSIYSFGGGLAMTEGGSVVGNNNIFYGNICNNSPNIYGTPTFTYTCVADTLLPGLGNVAQDPTFVSGPGGACYLSQTAAGQSVNSPCLDAGDPAATMIIGTTRTDQVQDVGVVDMGFHYPSLTTAIPPLSRGEVSHPSSFRLYPCFPEPFNPTTVLRFDLPQAGWVKLEVFDISGRVAGVGLKPAPTGGGSIPALRWFPAGTHEVTFDGSGLAAGIYFARLQAGEYVGVEKMVLLK